MRDIALVDGEFPTVVGGDFVVPILDSSYTLLILRWECVYMPP